MVLFVMNEILPFLSEQSCGEPTGQTGEAAMDLYEQSRIHDALYLISWFHFL